MKRVDLKTSRRRRGRAVSCTGGPPQCALAHASSAGLDDVARLRIDRILAASRRASAAPIVIGHGRDDVDDRDAKRFVREEPMGPLTRQDGGGSR